MDLSALFIIFGENTAEMVCVCVCGGGLISLSLK